MPPCCVCHKDFTKGDFSKAQLKKSPDQRKCKTCVTGSLLLHESSHEYHLPQTQYTDLAAATTTTRKSEEDEAVADIVVVVVEPTNTAELTTEEDNDRQHNTSKLSFNGVEEKDALKAQIIQLQTQLKEIQTTHQKEIQQLESKLSEAFQGMERAKQNIVHLESLATEAIANLNTVQEQAAIEFQSLRYQLEQAQKAERHNFLSKKTEP
jgi:hypothetical protein